MVKIVKIKVGLHTVKLVDDDKVAALIRLGPYEPETLKAWAEACEDGKAHTVIDVGAYAGLFSISAALMGNFAIAIEPKSELYSRTKENIGINRADNVVVIEAAASNRDGVGELHTNGSRFSFASSLTFDPVKQAHNRTRPVKICTLDSLRPMVKGKVGAIKIDVEAHETEVLEGACGIIARDRPVILVETLGDQVRTARVMEILRDYYCAAILDKRNLHMMPVREVNLA